MTNVNINDIKEAAKELSHSGLKLYLYLLEEENKEEIHLKPKKFMVTYNCSKSSYDRAKRELIEKGYIHQENNLTHFYTNKEYNSHELIKELRRLF